MLYVPSHVVGIDEGEESLWEGEGVAGEGGQLPRVALRGQDFQILGEGRVPGFAGGEKVATRPHLGHGIDGKILAVQLIDAVA